MGPARGVVVAGQVGRLRHHHAAVAKLQVQRLIDILPLLHERVLAHDPQVGAAVFHVGGDIGGAHDHVAHSMIGILEDQLAGIGEQFPAVDADPAEQRHRFFQDAAFGDCNGNPVVHISSFRMWLFRNLRVVVRNLLVRRSAATPPRASSSALTLRKIRIRYSFIL